MPGWIALPVALFIMWRVSLRMWPYARCRSCRGSSTSAGSNDRRWGICRRCGGSGKRRRLGAGRD